MYGTVQYVGHGLVTSSTVVLVLFFGFMCDTSTCTVTSTHIRSTVRCSSQARNAGAVSYGAVQYKDNTVFVSHRIVACNAVLLSIIATKGMFNAMWIDTTSRHSQPLQNVSIRRCDALRVLKS